jgi:hypothetical protein
MLADGGEAIADIDTVRDQSELLGVVASPPTAWRALEEATSAALKRVGRRGPGSAATCGARDNELLAADARDNGDLLALPL